MASETDGWLEAAREGVVVFDAAGKLTRANDAATELLGPVSEQPAAWVLLRADLSELPVDERPDELARRTRRPVFRKAVKLRTPQGAVHELLVTALPQLDAFGEVERVVTSLVDMKRNA